uniref:Uncharacterized protein n=1 Tax=Arundo donax TaxID=35708 RepID=A0A0A9AHQ8_ARUDO
MDEFNKWRPTVDSSISDLSKTVGDLMSRVGALEVNPQNAPLLAPPREEGAGQQPPRRSTSPGDSERTNTILQKPLGKSEFQLHRNQS